MYKLYIKMDEEKIKRERKYNLEAIHQYIDEKMSATNITKDKDGYYVGDSWEAFGAHIIGLSEAEWFLDNVKECRYYTPNEDSDTEPFYVEDLVYHYRYECERTSEAWKKRNGVL